MHAAAPMAPVFHLDGQLASDSHPVAELPVCSLRLMDDSNYPWLVLIPRVAEARELIDLDQDTRLAVMQEIDLAARVLKQEFRPYKLNVAALGNAVPQLHIHVIARRTDDPAWPKPIWGAVPAVPYDDDALAARLAELRAAFELE